MFPYLQYLTITFEVWEIGIRDCLGEIPLIAIFRWFAINMNSSVFVTDVIEIMSQSVMIQNRTQCKKEY